MSAAPLPKPEDAPAETGEAEGWALLDALRRKLDDQGAQTRRNAGHIAQLAEAMSALVAHQRRRARWLDLNSFVAYVVFTVLLGGGFYYLYQSRARELVVERDTAVRRADDAVRRADDASARQVARDAADAKALEAWQLFEAGKRDDARKRVAELASAPLSRLDREVLAARAKQPADTARADAAIKGAIAAFKAGRFGDAIAPVEAALAADPSGPRAAELHYLAGIAHLKTGEAGEAVTHLEAAVAANVAEDDAHFQLASALDRAGQWGRARSEYVQFASAHPQSKFAAYATRRSAMLAAMPAAAGAQPQPKPEAKPQPEPKAQPEPNSKSQPEPQPKSQPGPQSKAQPQPEPGAQPKPQVPAAGTQPAATAPAGAAVTQPAP